jgi:hypothetical protein
MLTMGRLYSSFCAAYCSLHQMTLPTGLAGDPAPSLWRLMCAVSISCLFCVVDIELNCLGYYILDVSVFDSLTRRVLRNHTNHIPLSSEESSDDGVHVEAVFSLVRRRCLVDLMVRVT